MYWPTGRGRARTALLRRLLIVLALLLVIRRWICCPALITGASMLPTLHNGHVGVINKLAYAFYPPHRGDIVAIWTGKELWVKRIVGLPGEEVEVRDGALHVNGNRLPEPYVAFNDCADIAPGRIGPNQYVVVGDNRRPTLTVLVDRSRILGRFSPL